MERNGLMGNVILKCTNLSKTYDFDNALNNVNLSIGLPNSKSNFPFISSFSWIIRTKWKWKNNFYKAVKWTSETY